MTTIRRVLIDLTQPAPHPVVDSDTCEAEEGADYHDTERNRWIVSDEAEIGWTWTEEGGLTPPGGGA